MHITASSKTQSLCGLPLLFALMLVGETFLCYFLTGQNFVTILWIRRTITDLSSQFGLVPSLEVQKDSYSFLVPHTTGNVSLS